MFEDFYIRICIAISMLTSIIILGLGLSQEDLLLPKSLWWIYLMCGISTLTVAIRLSSIWYKDR